MRLPAAAEAVNYSSSGGTLATSIWKGQAQGSLGPKGQLRELLWPKELGGMGKVGQGPLLGP